MDKGRELSFKNICTFHAWDLFDSIHFTYMSVKFHFILMLKLVVTLNWKVPYSIQWKKSIVRNLFSLLFVFYEGVFSLHIPCPSWCLYSLHFGGCWSPHLTCKSEEWRGHARLNYFSFVLLEVNCLQKEEFYSNPLYCKFYLSRLSAGDCLVQACYNLLGRRIKYP